MATYTTVQGDMWDAIAYNQLGSTDYTSQLIEANMDYRETFCFQAGIVLTLPEVTVSVSSKLPPWKQG